MAAQVFFWQGLVMISFKFPASGSLPVIFISLVCPHPSVSLNKDKKCREISEAIKQQFVRKLRVYGVGTLRIWIQHA